MSMLVAAVGRTLIALLFVISGTQKIVAPRSLSAMLAGAELPGWLAIPTGIFEVCGGLALASGFLTRVVSLVLAGFVALTIFFFHNRFTDPVQGVMALKNIAVIGGLLVVFAQAHMRLDHELPGERPWWRS